MSVSAILLRLVRKVLKLRNTESLMSTDTLLIDTGSSNTWLGASKAYSKTSTSKSTGQNVSVTYGSGSFNGTECEQISNSKLNFPTASIGASRFRY